MIIRSARADDALDILNIYSYYVENTAVSFEYDTPSLDEFSKRIEKTLINYPYLVLEENGVIKGYSYAGPLKERKAYDHSCEVTIYIDKDCKKNGYGRALYNALEEELLKRGITNFYACIGSPIVEDEYLTNDSENFHSKMGYKRCGLFTKCGYKFDRYYNMIWMEKIGG